MTTTTSKKLMGRLALSLSLAASLVGMHTAADAAFVVVNVDPAFDPVVRPNLGWSAFAALYVPTDSMGAALCAPTGGTKTMCAGVQIQDVTVKFYNTSTPSTIVETLHIGSYQMSPISTFQQLVSVSFDGSGKVIDFTTNYSNDVLATSPLAMHGGVSKYSLELGFTSSTLRLNGSNVLGSGFATSTVSNNAGTGTGGSIIVTYYTDTAYHAAFPSNVPEPSTLAMALSGLAAFTGRRFLTRRRRA